MDLPINFRPKIVPDRITHIIRHVQPDGQIFVTQNEEISPSNVLGKYHISGGFRSINLARELNVRPSEVKKYLKREIGKTIYEGELLAAKAEFFSKKEVKSPTDAVIQTLDEKNGILVLRMLPKEVQVLSGVFGVIDFIDAQNGNIYIKTHVTTIYGVLGSGTQRGGILKVIGNQKSITLADQISSDVHQTVLLGGSLIYIEAIQKALEYGAAGIIVGGINARDFMTVVGSQNFRAGFGNDMGLSLIIDQGFGGLQISDEVYKQIWGYEGKFIYIDGNNRKIMLPSQSPDSILKLRSVMLPIVQNKPVDPAQLQIGTISIGLKVRIIWPPFMGASGTVYSIDAQPTKLDSGITTYMVTLELLGQKIKVPFTNIEQIA